MTDRTRHAAPTARPASEDDRRVRKAYRAYSSQDIESLLTCVTDDVDWPDGDDRLRGKAEVRAYWTEQWSRLRTRDAPSVIAWLSDGICVVRIDQDVHDGDGAFVSSGSFAHVLHFTGPSIRRLDIVPLRP